MKRYRIVWTEVAVRDVESILVYVATHSGRMRARQLHDTLMKKIDALDVEPAHCRIVPELQQEGVDAYRELVVRPYRVMLRIRGRDVVLLAVVDGRRDLQELLLARTLEDL